VTLVGVIKEYIIPRIITYILVVFVGCSITFLIPRLTPLDPVEAVINRYAAYADFIDPQVLEELTETMKELYGLKGSLTDQYIAFLRRLFQGDLGPSLAAWPTPVIQIIRNSLPWTIALLSMTTIISWILGNLIGAIVAFYSEKKWAKVLSGFAMVIYPIPYYIMALILVILFTFIFPIFPGFGGVSIGVRPSLSLTFIMDYLYHAFLPALSLVTVGYGWWFLSMRSMAVNTKTEDFVIYAKTTGLSNRKILTKYVLRNTLLPQVTGLSVSLGGIFGGAIITEAIFAYPGIGGMLYTAITTGDFNLMMGIIIYSIIGVATATLIVDLLYPLVDPRIRYK